MNPPLISPGIERSLRTEQPPSPAERVQRAAVIYGAVLGDGAPETPAARARRELPGDVTALKAGMVAGVLFCVVMLTAHFAGVL